jgi:hypothetical protein
MAAREDERVMLSELALVVGVSVLAAIVICGVGSRRHEVPSPTPTPAG